MSQGLGDQVDTNFTRGAPYKIWEGKMSKIRRDFWQLSTLIANVLGMHRLVENLNSTWSTTFHPQLGEKMGELWSTNQKVIDAHVKPPNWTFSWDYNSALRGCWPLKFLHTSQLPKMYFKSYLRRRAASCWALPYISSLFLKDRIETVKEFYDKLNRFDTVQDCDGRTDRHVAAVYSALQ